MKNLFIVIIILFTLFFIYRFFKKNEEKYDEPQHQKFGVSKKAILEDCSSDSDCSNNACARLTAADGAKKVCCPSGNKDLYGGFDYCTEMEKNSVCFSDAMCKTGNCVKPVVNVMSPNVLCSTPDSSDPNSMDCTAFYIANGISTLVGNLIDKGVCQSKTDKEVGDFCDYRSGIEGHGNDGCQYGCGYESNSPNYENSHNPVCCKKGQSIITYNAIDYCGPFDDGQNCSVDKMCKSGHCLGCGDLACSKDSVCGKLKKMNENCQFDNDCENNVCARGTADDDAKLICCPYAQSIGSDTYGGYDYCKRMKDGDICWSNSMCESGTCEGGSIFGKGKCASSCGGETCPDNSSCISQIKSDGTNFSVCCPKNNVCKTMAGGQMCCATGSYCDQENMICLPNK